jgi:DNA replication protein DnaC
MEPMSSPERPATNAWRDRIPAAALAEAERLGPLPKVQGESPEDRAERLAIQAQNRAKRWTERLPSIYVAARLNQVDAEYAPRLARWLSDPDARTLVLAGSVGTGKTYAAYAVGHEAVAQGRWVEAWTLHDLLVASRPDGDKDALENARECDLLILDDLGATKVSEYAQETITALLDARLRTGRRQIVTTNLPWQPIEDAWGRRFTDRLRDGLVAVSMVGESRRAAAW